MVFVIGQLSYLPAHVCNSESVIKFNNNNTLYISFMVNYTW